jgi:hypothetical protein
VLAVPHGAWQPAVDADGQPRPGAEVAELHTLEPAGWPQGTGRSAAAKTPPGRPAQLHRRRRAPLPGVCHRPARPRGHHAGAAPPPPRACVEDRIRCGKATGLRNLPSIGGAATPSGWS